MVYVTVNTQLMSFVLVTQADLLLCAHADVRSGLNILIINEMGSAQCSCLIPVQCSFTSLYAEFSCCSYCSVWMCAI